MNKLTKIRLHGALGEEVGPEWDLEVTSVNEALRAIEYHSRRRLVKHLLEKHKEEVKYKVLINEKLVTYEKAITEDNLEDVTKSEICMNFDHIETIDIVPVLEGADIGGILGVILGAALMLSVFFIPGLNAYVATAMFIAGAGLLAAGIMTLLAKPPTMEPPKDIELKGATSYLFSNIVNTNKEGNPVPLIYGRMRVGSYVLESTYNSYSVVAHESPTNSEQISTIDSTIVVINEADTIEYT